uniref:NADH dehydrogenase subunit 4L n=1 Tax=Aleyrodes shizuokensis TaxID=860392 RepID=A0A7T1K7M6_9HEMI|nr:NADH dehydrogenase subunit 4L [Aleyrodes shizuokensis]QPO06180.1 NADH dehydrogenase subunit 4L [Aleyrodes shizuokensis]
MMNLEEVKIMILYYSILFTLYMFLKNHIINNLIIIEYLIILTILIMFNMLMIMKMENFLILYLLITAISESIIGLSMLISMIRTHSNDFMKSLSVMKF